MTKTTLKTTPKTTYECPQHKGTTYRTPIEYARHVRHGHPRHNNESLSPVGHQTHTKPQIRILDNPTQDITRALNASNAKHQGKAIHRAQNNTNGFTAALGPMGIIIAAHTPNDSVRLLEAAYTTRRPFKINVDQNDMITIIFPN